MTKRKGTSPRHGLGRTRQLFSAADIPDIVAATGHPIAPGASHQAIASGLTAAFFDAPFADEERMWPSNTELRSSYSLIAESARELLLALGFRSTVSDVLNFSVVDRKKLHEGAEFERLLAELALSVSPPQALAHDRQTALSSLHGAPKLIAILAHLAEWAETSIEDVPKRRGSPPEHALNFLFQALAGVFYAAFRLVPPVGSDRVDEAQGSLRWLRKVITLANERVDGSILLDYEGDDREQRIEAEPLVELVRQAHGFASATRANRLRDGWRAWLKLSDQEKWPMMIWWPSGFDGGSSSVPEWLR